jgi:hypothetical protein
MLTPGAFNQPSKEAAMLKEGSGLSQVRMSEYATEQYHAAGCKD